MDAEKAFDGAQHPFMIKTFRKLGVDGSFSNLIKSISKNPSGSMIPNGERLNAVLLTLGIKQGCPVSPLRLNIILEVPAGATKQEKEIRGIHSSTSGTGPSILS